MELFGSILRKQRELKGYSLEDAQEETKIQIRYLKALEEENFAIMPGEVFTKGFIRNYSEYLGLNYQEIMKKYYELQGATSAVDEASEVKEQPTSFSEAQEKSDDEVVKITVSWPVIALVLGLVLVSVWAFSKFTSPNEVAHNNPSQQTQQKPSSQPQASNPPKVEKPAPLPAPVYLKTVTTQECWVQVIVDDQKVFEGVLPPETKKEWKGQQKIALKLGNAGGVNVNYNNQELGTLGKKGEVITKVFTPAQ